MYSFGKVWLVGFGPGDPELLTIKGYRLLKKADVIFHDDLLNSEFLLKFRAEKVYVGKRKGNHSIEQAAINDLLYNAAVSGTLVYYMGASNLRTIAEEVVKRGWSPDTPVLLVYNISGNDQEEYFTTLLEAIYAPFKYKTPLIIVIGEVVRLKHKYAEYDIQSELCQIKVDINL